MMLVVAGETGEVSTFSSEAFDPIVKSDEGRLMLMKLLDIEPREEQDSPSSDEGQSESLDEGQTEQLTETWSEIKSLVSAR